MVRSIIPNFVNIFKNGLSLPPEEASIFLYIFGKGIFLSDIVIKTFYIEERLKADIKLPKTLEDGKNSVKVLGMNYADEKDRYFNEKGIEITIRDIIFNQD